MRRPDGLPMTLTPLSSTCLLYTSANKRQELDKVYAGDIAAAVGFKTTTTGDTICDDQHPVCLLYTSYILDGSDDDFPDYRNGRLLHHREQEGHEYPRCRENLYGKYYGSGTK